MHKRSKSSQLLQNIEEGLQPQSNANADSAGSNDVTNMALLVLLYAMQGVPLGLTLGSIPFILKTNATYTEVGLFSLASYPYSMKLIWSPIVDTVFSAKIGWRKSWILPIQMASGLLMILFAKTSNDWLENANIQAISILFFIFVLLAATQDIAVDGWALTLLSRKNVGHASTCQTIGMNSGYFLSFTIFLALNDVNFCNRYLRTTPKPNGILSLAQYFYFWGWLYIVVTVLLVFKPEKSYHHASGIQGTSYGRTSSGNVDAEADWQSQYSKPYEIRNGYFEEHGRFSNSKLEGRGRRKRSALLERSSNEQMPNLTRYVQVKQMYQKLWAVISLPNMRKLTIVLLTCKLGSITAEAAGIFKLMEKGVTRGTFFARISDSSMGGTYLTLLNTIANFGYAWPKVFVFLLIDLLTFQRCVGTDPSYASSQLSCPTKVGDGIENPCKNAGGVCVTILDGFYSLSMTMVAVGMAIGIFCARRLRELEMVKADSWRP